MSQVAHDSTRILIVDDEQRALTACQELLKLKHFDVTTCSDSRQVLGLIRSASYDAVLLDIRMPGLEGTDLLPLIKHLRPDVPVILVSAYCDPAHADYYQALGASATISKPFSHETLLDTLARTLQQEEAIPLTLTSLSLREGRDLVYRKLILSALIKTDWNQVRAAKLLGVSRYCLIRWMKRLGLGTDA